MAEVEFKANFPQLWNPCSSPPLSPALEQSLSNFNQHENHLRGSLKPWHSDSSGRGRGSRTCISNKLCCEVAAASGKDIFIHTLLYRARELTLSHGSKSLSCKHTPGATRIKEVLMSSFICFVKSQCFTHSAFKTSFQKKTFSDIWYLPCEGLSGVLETYIHNTQSCEVSVNVTFHAFPP